MSAPHPHPDARRLADYRAGELSASENLQVSDHLAECPACRARLPEGGVGRRVDLPSLLPDAPPDYEEMAALLDGSLDASQSADVRARLMASPEAAAAFADLQRFRGETMALPPKWHGPAETENLPATRKVVPFPRWSRASWIAAVAAAVMVFLSAGWWLTTGARPTNISSLWADADLSRLPDDLRRSVERATQTGTVDMPPSLAELNSSPETLAGTPPEPTTLRQISPVGVVVREDRPDLRWTAVKDATGYVVYLLGTEEGAPTLRQELSGGATAWTPPGPLARGATFEWQVEALRAGEVLARAPRPPAPEARFRVLDAQSAAELAGIERLYPQNALILGTAYARAGLVQAAGRQFETLARRYPESGAARRLHQEIVGGATAQE